MLAQPLKLDTTLSELSEISNHNLPTPTSPFPQAPATETATQYLAQLLAEIGLTMDSHLLDQFLSQKHEYIKMIDTPDNKFNFAQVSQ